MDATPTEAMPRGERHAYGAHYTSPVDIMKIVRPTIVQPWREQIDRADSPEGLRALRQRLQNYRVLDPACGSGNFLYLAYRELKRIEKELADKAAEAGAKPDRAQRLFGVVTSKQFFGLDILPFAVELAKVTMTIAHKLAIDELKMEEKALPLDNLDDNIRCIDALIDWPLDGSTPKDHDPSRTRAITPWPAADAIIGNPPFLGAKRLKPERGADYVNALRQLYPEVPGMADYCVYWFRRAHDHLRPATKDDPLTGRAGLVGTQNIRNNQSRVGGLDHIARSGTIIEAVENQPWSGEANVHVSIANWVKHEPSKAPGGRVPIRLEQDLALPPKRRLWRKIDPNSELFEPEKPANRTGTVVRGKRGGVLKSKSAELMRLEVAEINSALSDTVNASAARRLIYEPHEEFCYTGQYPRHEGFMVTLKEAKKLFKVQRANREVVHPFLVGRELLDDWNGCERYVIDFQTRGLLQAKAFAAPFAVVESKVLPHVRAKAREERKASGKDRGQDQTWLKNWWLHFRPRAELIGKIGALPRYIVCSRVTKRPIFVFLSSKIRPGDALSCFTFADDYSFAILQSSAHWQWFTAKCSKLTERFRYTPESVFDTFPWPQSPTTNQVKAVAAAAVELRRLRDKTLPTIKGGLRALYRTLELPGKNPLKDAHAALDTAVLRAYGFDPRKDILAQLLNLNLSVAARIEKGERVTPPGIPPGFRGPRSLVSADCIRPAPLPRTIPRASKRTRRAKR